MSQWLSLFLLRSLYATYTGHMLKFIEIYRVFLRQIERLNNSETSNSGFNAEPTS
jgi:hypothetical protein